MDSFVIFAGLVLTIGLLLPPLLCALGISRPQTLSAGSASSVGLGFDDLDEPSSVWARQLLDLGFSPRGR
jgi:hypothetical protein